MTHLFSNKLGVPKGYKATHVLSGDFNEDHYYVGFRVDEVTETVLDVKWWTNRIVDESQWVQLSYDVIGYSFDHAQDSFLVII